MTGRTVSSHAALALALAAWGGPAVAQPDLVLAAVGRPTSDTTCRDAAVSGTVEVRVGNAGDSGAPAFDVVVFQDVDRDGAWGAADVALGRARLAGGLAAGGEEALLVPVAGRLPFHLAPVHAVADPDGAVADTDPANDVAAGTVPCATPLQLELVVEWDWPDVGVLSTPVVGDVDADGAPDVAFVGMDGLAHVVRGDGSGPVWSTAPLDGTLDAASSLALADLDGDPGLEMVALAESRARLISFDHDGSRRWVSDLRALTGTGPGGAVAIADLDCDGFPEAVYGPDAFAGDTGRRAWTPEAGGTLGTPVDWAGPAASVLDVDGDGRLEVVAGPTAYTFEAATGTGRILWRADGVGDGHTAAGPFDGDPEPEIVVVTESELVLLDGESGAVAWRVPRTGPDPCGAGPGGPPLVADLDGDGRPEIGVAGGSAFTAYRADGSVAWSAPIEDCSSGLTAAAAVDLDGDGLPEIAHHDQLGLHVLRGTDGTELARLAGSSATWQELVTVADVDGDGEAELLWPLSETRQAFDTGIRAAGQLGGGWASTRREWNQHAWHRDNLLAGGAVPGPADGCEAPSWTSHGTWRAQGSSAEPAALPDLTVTILDDVVEEDGSCNPRRRLDLRVGNAGTVATGMASELRLHEAAVDGPLLATYAVPDLQPGEWTDVTWQGSFDPEAPAVIHVVADDDGAGGVVPECSELNNACAATDTVSPPSLSAPAPVGNALRARGHGPPRAPLAEARFEWPSDEGAPRVDGEHYHLLRGTAPDGLLGVFDLEPLPVPEWDEATPNDLPVHRIHYYRVLAATRCEVTE